MRLAALPARVQEPRDIGNKGKNPMTNKIAIASAASASLILAVPALANPYDDCILQHMGTAQNEAAVNAIESACIAKTSVAIPPDDFRGGIDADLGNFNTGSGTLEYGLVVTLKNTTNFNITEVVVIVRDKTTKAATQYPVHDFDAPLPPGAWLTKLAKPANRQIIKAGDTRKFFARINEGKNNPSSFTQHFTWGVVPKKGILE
jgi:hypothetical protein